MTRDEVLLTFNDHEGEDVTVSVMIGDHLVLWFSGELRHAGGGALAAQIPEHGDEISGLYVIGDPDEDSAIDLAPSLPIEANPIRMPDGETIGGLRIGLSDAVLMDVMWAGGES